MKKTKKALAAVSKLAQSVGGNSKLADLQDLVSEAVKVAMEIDQYEKTTMDMGTMNEVQLALADLLSAEKVLRGI